MSFNQWKSLLNKRNSKNLLKQKEYSRNLEEMQILEKDFTLKEISILNLNLLKARKKIKGP